MARPLGAVPEAISVRLRAVGMLTVVTCRKARLEVPPPGAGLVTVIWAVAAVATLEAGTLAVSFELLTKLVVNGVPFQLMVVPETKFTPFTVRVKPAPPGTALAGIKGLLMKGTAFAVPDPVRMIECGLVGLSESKMTSCPFRRPGAVGTSFTLNVQLAPPAMPLPHVLV